MSYHPIYIAKVTLTSNTWYLRCRNTICTLLLCWIDSTRDKSHPLVLESVILIELHFLVALNIVSDIAKLSNQLLRCCQYNPSRLHMSEWQRMLWLVYLNAWFYHYFSELTLVFSTPFHRKMTKRQVLNRMKMLLALHWCKLHLDPVIWCWNTIGWLAGVAALTPCCQVIQVISW